MTAREKKLLFFLLLHGSTTSELLLMTADDSFFNFRKEIGLLMILPNGSCLLMEYDMPMRSESCFAAVFQPVG